MGRTDEGELGKIVGKYHNRKHRWALIILGVGVVLGVVGMVIEPTRILLVFVGLILGLIGLFSLPSALINAKNKVTLYEKGFVFKIRRQEGVVRWKDVSEVARADKNYIVRYGRRKEIAFTGANIQKARKIWSHIENQSGH